MDRETSADHPPQRHGIRFTATGSEYLRIWIVNLLLIVVTLGICLPWAKVRKLKYFYSNTWFDGDALDFHVDPRRAAGIRPRAVVAFFEAIERWRGTRAPDAPQGAEAGGLGLAFSSHPATAERIAFFREAPED